MKIYRVYSDTRSYFFSGIWESPSHYMSPTKDGIEYDSFPKDSWKMEEVDVKEIGTITPGITKND